MHEAMPKTSKTKPSSSAKISADKRTYYSTPFGEYFQELDEIDKDWKESDEYGSFLILGLVEEIGEMARAYLAKHGRKPRNLAAQSDETYEQELGDILLTVLRFARIKHINLDDRIRYSLDKIKKRKAKPKAAPKSE
jgi:NTP pyrophosphatase (non-canonical NTP hydrolase)